MLPEAMRFLILVYRACQKASFPPMDQKGTPRIVVYSPRGTHRIRWAGEARLGGVRGESRIVWLQIWLCCPACRLVVQRGEEGAKRGLGC
jgi:hypothetical protein